MKFYSPRKNKMKKKQPPKNEQVSAPLRHSRNFELEPADLETTDPLSETVPDQTPALQDLLQKRANGHLITMLDGQYTDHEIPDLELMDEVEIMQYRIDVAENMEKLSAEHHQLTKELEKRQSDEKFEQELKKRQQQAEAPDAEAKQ